MAGGWRSRVPARAELVRVFAATAFLVYSWTMYVSFWKLPSWLYFLGLGEIASLYSYGFIANLIECLLLTGLTAALSLLLPRAWWRDGFVARSVVIILVLLVSAQWHLSRYPTHDLRDAFLASQPLWWLATLAIGVVLAWCAGRFRWMRTGLERIADQLTVFLYLYLPLTLIGLIVVVVRVVG